MSPSFDTQLSRAQEELLVGWDFTTLAARIREDEPSWNYRELVGAALSELEAGAAVLDMGTGGGELLSDLTGLPADTRATERYAPNVPLARAVLEPRGIAVDRVDDDAQLPYPDRRFDLVLNRHGAFDAGEVRRILRRGGTFLTQQVGSDNLVELNERLEAPPRDYAGWDLATSSARLRSAGLTIRDSGEEHPATTFNDIGAVVRYLLAIPWQVPGFTVEAYLGPLRRLHESMAHQPLVVAAHRFYLLAGVGVAR